VARPGNPVAIETDNDRLSGEKTIDSKCMTVEASSRALVAQLQEADAIFNECKVLAPVSQAFEGSESMLELRRAEYSRKGLVFGGMERGKTDRLKNLRIILLASISWFPTRLWTPTR
jgi:hypothetical protein